MRSEISVSTRRWLLLALLLALPASVDCVKKTCTTDCLVPEPATYEMFFACDDGNPGEIAVTAGVASDTATRDECFAAEPEAEAVDTIDGIDASVRFFGQNQGPQMVLTCAYEIGADLEAPLTCAGTTRRDFGFEYLSGDTQITVDLFARSIALTDGDASSFLGSAYLACFGEAPVRIPFDGDSVTTPLLPLVDGSCDIAIEIDSAVASAGMTTHSISVYFAESRGCRHDADCNAGERCGPQQRCQLGDEGNLCSTGYVSPTMGDCNEFAPICRIGRFGQVSACQDGSHGDVCGQPEECAGGTRCIPVFFQSVCQDGRQGSFCQTQDDCADPQQCFTGGGIGLCTTECTTAADCELPFGCVPIPGFPSVCTRCSANEHCDQSLGEVCIAGVCQ